MRDSTHTIRALAPRARRAAALFAALVFALHASAGAALAQDGTAGGQDKVSKETVVHHIPVGDLTSWAGLARRGEELFDRGKLGPDTRLDVTAKGERADDGTLKPETVVLTWTDASDEATASLAQQLFKAFGESRVLGVLEGVKEVSVRLRLDQTNAFLSITAEMPSDARAKELSDGYGMLLRLKAIEERGTREGELYKAVRFVSDGRLLTLAFEMPKERLSAVITEALAKRAAGPKN